jgi:hypothetical protein
LRQSPDDISDERHRQHAQAQEGVRRFEHRGTFDVAHAVGTVGDGDPIHHDERDDLLKADRYHCQIVTSEAQRRHAKERAHHQRDAYPHRECDPEIQMQIGGAEPDSVGAEAEKGRLREIDLPAEAEHNAQAEHRDGIARRLHEDVHHVVGQRHERDACNGQRRKRDVGHRAFEPA